MLFDVLIFKGPISPILAALFISITFALLNEGNLMALTVSKSDRSTLVKTKLGC